MANVDDVYGSGKYLKAEDLKGRAIKVKIESCHLAEFDNGKKITLKLVGKERMLTLNKTNTKIIAKYYGKDYDQWGGKEIEIFPTETEFQGSLVPCIRVRVEAPKAEGEDFDDEIPF